MFTINEISLATTVLLNELIETLIENGILTREQHISILEAAARRLDDAPLTSTEANAKAAEFLRTISRR